MESLMKSDIFFFITSIAVVILSILFIVALIYVIAIAKDLKYISKRAKQETDNLSSEIQELRQNIREQGLKLKTIKNFLVNFFEKKKK